MSQIHNPRSGSLAFRPKVRARRIYGKIKSIKHSSDAIGEYAGYKVGMTYVNYVCNKKGSPLYDKKVVTPVTLIEVPDLQVVGFRCYTEEETGLTVYKDILNINKNSILKKKTIISKKDITPKDKDFKDIEQKIADNKIVDIKLMVHTMPQETGMTKKKPELFEMFIGGNSVSDKFNFAKEKISKTISIKDFIEEGTMIDASGVTKGKGFAGSIKRWGIHLLAKKSQKVIRKAGNLGPWHPAKTQATVPQMGQLGFFNRVINNLCVMKIITKDTDDEIFAKIKTKPFKKYGMIKSSYIVVKGSVTGPSKRLIRMRKAIKKQTGTSSEAIDIKYID
ncbi:MAG: 50S ribosomal protein L3 [Candidatus Aenigmarchaeota archaeon]|nr:50S ribosomal protein L3 [Candidatus Aenigmarchaeota archaeon]